MRHKATGKGGGIMAIFGVGAYYEGDDVSPEFIQANIVGDSAHHHRHEGKTSIY